MGAQAKRCRRLASSCNGWMRDSLNSMADDYQGRADRGSSSDQNDGGASE